nr:MAG TPA: hypothetical protein [Caudoviricetes sp.]
MFRAKINLPYINTIILCNRQNLADSDIRNIFFPRTICLLRYSNIGCNLLLCSIFSRSKFFERVHAIVFFHRLTAFLCFTVYMKNIHVSIAYLNFFLVFFSFSKIHLNLFQIYCMMYPSRKG